MGSDIAAHDHIHRLGESATHPIELRYGTLTALLLVAGTSPQPRHACRAHHRFHALVVPQADSMLSEIPATPLSASRIAAHSAASNYRY